MAVYRPSGPGAVIVSGNLISTQRAWITADKTLMAAAPLPSDKSRAYAAIDTSQVLVGDYLTGKRWAGGIVETFFLESMDLPAPLTVIRCDTFISITRAAGNSGPGVKPYGGRTEATDVPMLTDWPASVGKGGRMEAGRVNLPGDPSMGGYQVLLPASLPVVIETGDRITDNQGRAMVVNFADRSPMGWMLGCTLAAA